MKLFSIVFILLTPFSFAGTLHEKNTIRDPQGKVRYFHYYIPERMPANSPMVILFHGGTQDYSAILEQSSAQSEWLKIADEEKFLLVIPNGTDAATGNGSGTNQHWNDCRADAPEVETGADDVGFISNLIDWAAAQYRIDTRSVYATGASNGGMMSYRLAAELSDKIAAVAAFIANLPRESECKAPPRPISVFICNGTRDSWMPWAGGEVKKGGSVISALATRDFWIQLNATKTGPRFERNGNVGIETYAGGSAGTEVMFYTVEGGGHTIPSIDHKLTRMVQWIVGPQNQDIEGAREAWNFLRRQKLHP
jgi:polyhydroxybutyrate depolymerase